MAPKHGDIRNPVFSSEVHMRSPLSWIFIPILLIPPLQAQVETPAYRNPKLSIGDRVSDLLARMTLEEKVDQITGGHRKNAGVVDPTGQFSQEKLEEALKGLWDLNSHMSPHDRAMLHNALQRYLLEKTRLWESRPCSKAKPCMASWPTGAPAFRRRSGWHRRGIRH